MSAQLHDQDFYTWTLRQAELLREGRFAELDAEHLIEELESMGAREKRELGNRFAVLLAHLLKWKYQPERIGNSWKRTLKIQRIEIGDLIADNPGLKSQLDNIFGKAYQKARVLAADETPLDESAFPVQSPFSLSEVLDLRFFPTR